MHARRTSNVFLLVFMLASVSAFVGAIPRATAAPLRDDPKATETQLESWWADLEKADFEASRALLKFSAQPQEAAAFLKRKLLPLKIDAARAKALIADLGNQKEEVWKNAFEQLDYFDPRLAIDLETLMKDVTDTPNRQRMVEILSGRPAGSLGAKQIQLRSIDEEGYNFMADGGSWWAEHRVARINSHYWASPKKKWTRAVRAIALLEHINSPEAVAILKEMATGHAEAQPTLAAVEAVKRLTEKGR